MRKGKWSPEAKERVRQRKEKKRAENLASAAHEVNRILGRSPQTRNEILGQVGEGNPAPEWMRRNWSSIKIAAKALGYRWFLHRNSRLGWYKGGIVGRDDLFGEKHIMKVVEGIKGVMNKLALLPPYQSTITVSLIPPTK